MTDQPAVVCPVCGAAMTWDPGDERYECEGPVEHCFTIEQEDGARKLMLTASSSGEDAELFSTYPLTPGAAAVEAASPAAASAAPGCPVCGYDLTWDGGDERYECKGPVQHCYTVEGSGAARELMLTASASGEDAELFSTYPFPE